ncbi:MAG: aquaporin family protein [Gammaproteobacteria bacterium]|nr:aquaporin family protein [Gammaproteobacteria bacterium]MDH5302908.1 aquaporin family protein [Gammaproteobacteria bacterium]MDH5321013.1 aquaporin family protein [Gammaproteobacteria bacterium]
MKNLARAAIIAELLGTALLLATVVGSGIMAQALADGNAAIMLLANSLATGAILVVLILALAGESGAHFNPVVSLVFYLRKDISGSQLIYYLFAQLCGAVIGVLLAHAMFDQPLVSEYSTPRTGQGQFLSELVAAFGLVAAILATLRRGVAAVAASVGLYITAAYWFTASTSFANPAVTLARALTGSFSGIRMVDVPMFILAQLLGAMLAFYLARGFRKPGSQ